MKNKNKFLSKLISSIKLIDLVIILFLLLFAGVAFMFFYRKSDYIQIRVKVTNQEVLEAFHIPNNMYALHFVEGDIEKDSLGNVISEIVNVDVYPLYLNNSAVFVDLKVKATYDSRTESYSSRGQEIAYGAPVRFALSNVVFDGYVVDFPDKKMSAEIAEKKAAISLRTRMVEPEQIEALEEGLSFTDVKGNEVFYIDKIRGSNAQIVTTDSRGFSYLRYHPFLKDVDITIITNLQKINSKYYLHEHESLSIGQNITLSVGPNFLSGTITAISEIE